VPALRRREGGGGIRDQHGPVAEVVRLPQRGLDAYMEREAGDQQRVEPFLVAQVGAAGPASFG
jgi:hypothetical protein